MWWVGRVRQEDICVELGGDEGFQLRVKFILPLGVWAPICLQKGLRCSTPPLSPSPSSGQPDLLSCPTPQAPFCPRAFALAEPSTGPPCPSPAMAGAIALSSLKVNFVSLESPPHSPCPGQAAPAITSLFIFFFKTLMSTSNGIQGCCHLPLLSSPKL